MLLRYKKQNKKQKTVNWIIRDNHWRGFQHGLTDSSRCALEYASRSGWYQYNGIRLIAYEAGYDLAQQVLTERDRRKSADSEWVRVFGKTFQYQIPASLYRRCYDEVGLFATRAEEGGNNAP